MPRIRHRLRLALLALLIAASPLAIDAQRGARITRTGGGSGTMPISASVMTTYLTRSEDGVESLVALVIWRGEPGWIGVGDSSGSSSSSSDRMARHRFSQGGHEFEVEVDLAARTLMVLNSTVDLRKGNVVFVDHIGSAQGPRIVRTLLIDGTLAATPDRNPVRILDVMRRSPEIRDSLRRAAVERGVAEASRTCLRQDPRAVTPARASGIGDRGPGSEFGGSTTLPSTDEPGVLRFADDNGLFVELSPATGR